jgi:hypothetical protein
MIKDNIIIQHTHDGIMKPSSFQSGLLAWTKAPIVHLKVPKTEKEKELDSGI